MYVRSTLYEKLSSEKRHDRVLETSFKRVRNLPFKLFSNRKLSSPANHGDDIFEDFEPPSKNSQLRPCLLRIFCLLSWKIDFLIMRLKIKAKQMKKISPNIKRKWQFDKGFENITPKIHPTSNNCSNKYKLHKKQFWVISASDCFKYWWN